MSLKLLHISDIHFKDYKDNQYLDLDKEIQREIELDLSALKESYGNIDIVLIGGDIAYSGREEEYNYAYSWIQHICDITGCKEENVLSVPGNHDVERTKIGPVTKMVHDKFKKSRNRTEIDQALTEILLHKSSSEQLLQPIQNYNSFAARYGALPESNLLYWEKNFQLDGRILRIRGLNSALVSNSTDDENTSKLILGSSQTSFLRENGLIYLVMCHHPSSWLIDGESAMTDLKAKASILLFGHKHSYSDDVLNNRNLVLAAGAMQPSRHESNWEPRYNILDLSINTDGQEPKLAVKLFKRVWSKKTNKFVADYDDKGSSIIEYHLNLSREEQALSTATQKNVDKEELKSTTMEETVIDANNPNPRRKLAYDFLRLPYHIRLSIAVRMNLIDDSDKDLNENQKNQLYFKRAVERQQLNILWEEVNKNIDNSLNNPFTK